MFPILVFLIAACSSSSGGGGSSHPMPDAGTQMQKKQLGESCACSGMSGTFWYCSGTSSPCDTELNCVGGGSSGACYGAMCCSGSSECDVAHQGANNDKCPSGQVCATFDGAIGFCGNLH